MHRICKIESNIKCVEVKSTEKQSETKRERFSFNTKNITVSERGRRLMVITRKLLSCNNVNLYNLTSERSL